MVRRVEIRAGSKPLASSADMSVILTPGQYLGVGGSGKGDGVSDCDNAGGSGGGGVCGGGKAGVAVMAVMVAVVVVGGRSVCVVSVAVRLSWGERTPWSALAASRTPAWSRVLLCLDCPQSCCRTPHTPAYGSERGDSGRCDSLPWAMREKGARRGGGEREEGWQPSQSYRVGKATV